jgi:hypothetical protein
MKLSEQDARLFFELTWALQFYTNQKLNILSDVESLEEYESLNQDEQFNVREALYENIELIDDFVKENPFDFDDEKLEIIKSWKDFVRGNFYIERYLKKYTIFIGEDGKVYGVLGLSNALEEMIHPSHLPLFIRAVLLPFKGKIIYDGLFQSYNIHFGRGISSDLKEQYMAAKQNNKIIVSLDPKIQKAKKQKAKKAIKDWTAEIDELVEKAKKLRGGKTQPAIYTPVFSLVKKSLKLAQIAVENPDDLKIDKLWKTVKKVDRALSKVERVLDRAERYQ